MRGPRGVDTGERVVQTAAGGYAFNYFLHIATSLGSAGGNNISQECITNAIKLDVLSTPYVRTTAIQHHA
jgi:hypothetical protein